MERFDVAATIRGIRVSGAGFDDLACEAPAAGLSTNSAGELVDCTLIARSPALIDDQVGELVLDFQLGTGRPEPLVRATLTVGQRSYHSSQDGLLEAVLGDLADQLRPARWECCLTCLLSDYSPAGQDLMGMRCHRTARAQYLAVTSKAEYWDVPVTEEVPEFYRCAAYEPRVPGTGYRG